MYMTLDADSCSVSTDRIWERSGGPLSVCLLSPPPARRVHQSHEGEPSRLETAVAQWLEERCNETVWFVVRHSCGEDCCSF